MNIPDSAETPPTGGESSGARWLRGAFVAIAATTAAGAPWLLGGETVRTEWWLLGGGILTFAIGLLVRWRVPSSAEGRASWRVARWALGLGAIFLVLLGIQARNPSHRVVLEHRLWRLEPLSPVEWAPKSLEAPFNALPGDGLPYRNTQRYLLIFGIAWTFAAGLALGLTQARDARRFARLLGMNAALLGVVCIVHVATGSPLTLWRFFGTFDFSHSPVFFYKNHNGAYLAASLAVVLGLASAAGAPRSRWAWEAVAFVVWVATVMVDSRVATTGATLLGLGYLARSATKAASGSRRRRRLAGVWMVLIAAGGLLVAMRETAAVRRFAPLLSEPRDFVQGGAFRGLLREVGCEMWVDRPVWGWGGGTFLYLFNTYHVRVPALAETFYRQQPTLNRFYWPTANCDWIEFAVEYGAVGLLLLAGIALTPASAWWRWRKRNAGLGTFLLTGTAMLVAHGFFDYVLRNPAIMILFASLQIVALSVMAPNEKTPVHETSPNLPVPAPS